MIGASYEAGNQLAAAKEQPRVRRIEAGSFRRWRIRRPSVGHQRLGSPDALSFSRIAGLRRGGTQPLLTMHFEEAL